MENFDKDKLAKASNIYIPSEFDIAFRQWKARQDEYHPKYMYIAKLYEAVMDGGDLEVTIPLCSLSGTVTDEQIERLEDIKIPYHKNIDSIMLEEDESYADMGLQKQLELRFLSNLCDRALKKPDEVEVEFFKIDNSSGVLPNDMVEELNEDHKDLYFQRMKKEKKYEECIKLAKTEAEKQYFDNCATKQRELNLQSESSQKLKPKKSFGQKIEKFLQSILV